MKDLNAKDIEKLENTSAASVVASEAVGLTEGDLGGPCIVMSECVALSICEHTYDQITQSIDTGTTHVEESGQFGPLLASYLRQALA